MEQNIRSVAALERSFEEKRDWVGRIADVIAGFSGSMAFVALHVLWFVLWFLINTRVGRQIPGIRAIPVFDPYPFILLAMVVSVEGVLLSTFVLMKQNRMQQRSDNRHQLDLQINLLAEEEVTKSLQLLRAIATRLGIEEVQHDDELAEMSQTTSVGDLGERIGTELSRSD